MIKNYLKIAWRNLIKNKAHTFINMAGLSVGLACSLLIMLWVQNELSVDAFHKNGDRLYSIYERQYFDNKIQGQYNTPGLLAEELKKQIPEIEYATGNSYGGESTFQAGDKILKMTGTDVGDDYLKMFSFSLLQGTAQTALNSPVSMAISRKMAQSFFGSPQAAIGKTIRFENKKDFKVTAVFEDMPKNSSQKYDYLMNWYHFVDANGQVKDWGNNWPATVIMLRADANPASVEKKLTHFLDNLNKDQKKGTFTIEIGIQRFGDLYLHNNFVNGKIEGGRIEYVHLFTIVAIFILLIACINFMNLTTARSVKRAREIGVRKVVGAVRSVLIKQFIGESLLITSLAVVVSLVLLVLLLPVFNQITRKEIELPFNQVGFWVKLAGITLITGLISGSYPALFLSSFNPVKVLKGTMKLDTGTTLFRKGLVIFQFALSVILITATIIISRQMAYVQSTNLGYDRENLIYLPINGELIPKYSTFKDEVVGMPGIESVTRVSNTPTIIENSTGGVQWIGKNPNVNIQFTQISVGYDFVKTMKLKVLAGRDFSKAFVTDSVGYMVNEAALKRIGYKAPIGQPLTQWGKKGKIIGLIKDFHFNSMHEQIMPLIIRLGEQEGYGSLLIRTEPGKTKQALASLETLCKQINPAFPFTYTFSDQEYLKLYQNEQIVTKLSNAFAFLAIFISCLGLLGLAMFTAEQRIKEIGIRKVLGASLGSLFSLLSSEFLVLVIIALMIALPVSWYAMNRWLQGFAYRTSLQWWMFALSGMIIILIATVTVSFQAVKAALIKPIKSLRSE
ncbi:ABC transporter permease [Mucilaginibacter lappiensis]|uniref:Permease n=1 Tax=Mucilaginibacter lappiensis TaxID=354630 RepID=A0A1N6T9F2_9SPHI|nr:ABC transporter permease [Mucilaginibacter lappiensis]MBB6108153.1 putative permease [Mucilaginibacter lappiensis]MBB6130298.1 putative permease [Mucilaginibacter lappiensis]SIQ49933.1 duplicated orphan permease [Mucilaginibacter lappiensis]